MNVLHVINNLRREGAQVQLFNQVTAEIDDGISYSVCVRQPGGPLAAELRERGVDVIEPTQYYGFVSIRKSVILLKQACLDKKVDVIHAHMADAAVLGWMVARALSLPLVISHHGQDILLKCNPVCRLVYWLLLMLAAHYAAMNIAVSPSVAERVKKLLRIDRQKLCVIANGVGIPRCPEAASRRQKNRNSPLAIVNLGRLVPLKGQRQLVNAMAGLIKDFPRARLYIVGGGDMGPVLKQFATDRQVSEHIEFTGMVNNVAEYLAKADIYVSSSRSEGMPISILEAMAWRIPVVASDIPGHRSVVRPGETGFLYQLDDIDDLVGTLVAVADDQQHASEVASRARAMVEQSYSAEVCRQKHGELYRSLEKQV